VSLCQIAQWLTTISSRAPKILTECLERSPSWSCIWIVGQSPNSNYTVSTKTASHSPFATAAIPRIFDASGLSVGSISLFRVFQRPPELKTLVVTGMPSDNIVAALNRLRDDSEGPVILRRLRYLYTRGIGENSLSLTRFLEPLSVSPSPSVTRLRRRKKRQQSFQLKGWQLECLWTSVARSSVFATGDGMYLGI